MPGKPEQNVEDLVARSASTDVQVLLTAKENAKRAALDEPSQANLAALDRASKMLESAMQATTSLKDWRAVLAYVEEQGRKLGKTKFFEDVKLGRLRKQTDGTFRRRDVDRYLVTLPVLGTSDVVAERAADRQRRKEEQEIRRIKAIADKEEFLLEVRRGAYIPKDQVHQELAARAVTLAAGLKTAFEAHSLDLIDTVEGNPKKSVALTGKLETMLEEALNEYSREMEFEVTFAAESDKEATGDSDE
ncbi:MAG: hypothetical protein IJD16_09155 [Desulfovibrio sp.]|nr:hypothetical protein [Desulfovibrio sp.]